ncbi:LacI family DNA-binding transcriptional regulator [Alkalicoccobacillus porphyridii]|uniref:LacI family transcriptional regulator n=1 Tax=Alkalicoccobacillus porphyridii TaxID=2597270 RepID=A0A554A3K0_9BACI|nr:LacI family DNA-binding transcriptional regulator [Alkalicoccobacillus porphyridii]TSB48269.1 LacI family transcriptional regulator [Alkalicoccobacillus porphyridii]
MGQKKITMQVIADTVGVSKYVVSKTLNSKPGVSETTRQKILFTAKQLGYFKERENGNGQSNSGSIEVENGYILVVLPNYEYQSISYTYWGAVFQGLSVGIQSKKAGMIVITSEMDLTKKVDVTNLIGIITVGTLDEQTLISLTDYQLPIVMVDHEDKLMQADSIFMDNQNGVERMTNHLIGLGHKQIMFVGQINYSRSFYDRWMGFRKAMEQAGFDECTKENALIDIRYNDDFEIYLQEKINEMMRKKTLPTAFVCANDHIARRVIDQFQLNGYKVPEDFSVTGFDMLDEEEGKTPSLTTVQVLKQVIGQRAVDRLVWRIQHTEYPPEKILIIGDMHIKESIDKPKRD